MKFILVTIFVLLAAALGMGVSVFGGGLVLLAMAAMLPLPIIFKDYRAGVILLTLVLPVASMLPAVRGLNVLTYVTLATLASLSMRQAFGSQPMVRLPRILICCLVVPATWGVVIAWPHIPQGVRNYPDLEDVRTLFDPWSYVTGRYIKPLFYYLSYALLLANAVRDSRQPQRFVALLAVSALLPALAVFYTVATYPGSLLDVSRNREFMAPRGMHANEFGMLLALAAGPLLFMVGGTRKAAWRWWWVLSFGVVSAALLLTFSRGALTAYLVVVAGYLLHHKRVKTFFVGVAVIALVLLAAPESMRERFGTGLREGALSDASSVEKDDLTAGRVHGWVLLAPEVLESPWLGRGLGSTQWSSAVALGQYKANHPHNIYLEILMDLGLLGFVMMAWLHAQYLRRFKLLACDANLPDEMQAYFAGARYGLLGMLAMAATTAYFMPNGAQAYLWFSLGLAFSYWPETRRVDVPVGHSALAL